jgi:hypothetical protein
MTAAPSLRSGTLVTLIPSRHGVPHGARRALPLAAFRAAQAFHYVSQLRIPSDNVSQGGRVTPPRMAAPARQDDGVLPELVAELVDLQGPHADTVYASRPTVKVSLLPAFAVPCAVHQSLLLLAPVC